MKFLTLMMSLIFLAVSASAITKASDVEGKSPCLNSNTAGYKGDAGIYGSLMLNQYGNEICAFEKNSYGTIVTYSMYVGYTDPNANQDLIKTTFGSQKFKIKVLLNHQNQLKLMSISSTHKVLYPEMKDMTEQVLNKSQDLKETIRSLN